MTPRELWRGIKLASTSLLNGSTCITTFCYHLFVCLFQRTADRPPTASPTMADPIEFQLADGTPSGPQ